MGPPPRDCASRAVRSGGPAGGPGPAGTDVTPRWDCRARRTAPRVGGASGPSRSQRATAGVVEPKTPRPSARTSIRTRPPPVRRSPSPTVGFGCPTTQCTADYTATLPTHVRDTRRRSRRRTHRANWNRQPNRPSRNGFTHAVHGRSCYTANETPRNAPYICPHMEEPADQTAPAYGASDPCYPSAGLRTPRPPRFNTCV